MKRITLLSMIFCLTLSMFGQTEKANTTFKFGGYIKADFLNTWYQNGEIASNSPMRDFHLSSQIPVGEIDQNFDMDYHVKETRFNFDVKTDVLGKEIHGFIELDFLLSSSGTAKVTNSYNPRLRHAYMEWDRILIGQTWSTFMIVVVPDEIDFTGALDGLVLIRQPQVRYSVGSWCFSLENPETSVVEYQENAAYMTNSELSPDIVARKNFKGERASWSIAAIGRTLHQHDSLKRTTFGFGLSTGGKIKVGKRDDIRMVTSGGQGLGRYLSAGFVPSASHDMNGNLEAITALNGFVAYNHYWADKFSSSFSFAAYKAFHNEEIVSDKINNSSYSVSGNIKYDPIDKLRFGVEYAYGQRALLDNTSGEFHRIQFAAKYFFGYKNSVSNEKQ